MFRLGIDETMVDTPAQLTLPQMVKLAETNQLVCNLRFSDHQTIEQLTKESRVDDLQQIHTGIPAFQSPAARAPRQRRRCSEEKVFDNG